MSKQKSKHEPINSEYRTTFEDPVEVQYRTFSPFVGGVQVSINRYLELYPELKAHEDCSKLNAIELMWCWYYGSKESPFNQKYFNKKERAYHITQYLYRHENKKHYIEDATREELENGKISHLWYKVIDFFFKTNTDIRQGAKSMVESIYEEYRQIIEQGRSAFEDDDGNIDFNKYTATMAKIRNELPSLIKTIEEGYGVTRTVGGAGSDELAIYENWIKNKR